MIYTNTNIPKTLVTDTTPMDIAWYVDSGFWFHGEFSLVPEGAGYTQDLLDIESPVFFRREGRDPCGFEQCMVGDGPLYVVEEKHADEASFFNEVDRVINHLVLYEDYKDAVKARTEAIEEKREQILECLEDDNLAVRDGSMGVLSDKFIEDALLAVETGDTQSFVNEYHDQCSYTLENEVYNIVLGISGG